MMSNLEPLLIFFGVAFVIMASFGVGFTFGWFRGADELDQTRRELVDVQADAVASLDTLERQLRQIRAESESRARIVTEQADKLLRLTRDLEQAQAQAQARRAS